VLSSTTHATLDNRPTKGSRLMWFLGLLLLAAAGGLALGHRSQQRKLGLLASTEIYTVQHLEELAASMAEGLGEGSLRFFAAVSGAVRCAEPLVSELAEAESVHYSMHVRREVEETRPSQSSGGEERTQKSTQQLAHSQRSVAFEIEDATGSLAVDPAGASFTTENTISRFEPAGAGARTLSLGSFSLDLPNLPDDDVSRTLGYRYEEVVIPVGREVYVLGEVTDPGGELVMSSPKDDKLIVSVKSREQLIKEAGSGSKLMKGAAIVCGVLGLLLVILNL
jgi:hypothetical protein